MSENKYLEALGQPFPYSDVHWRMQYVDPNTSEGFAVPYLDARAIADRFDNVIGQGNWNDSYETWHTYTETTTERGKETVREIQSQLCTIYVYNEERKEWLGKTDGAENTDIESIKGGLSDSFKRAAVKWNVGRYMYKMNTIWIKAKKRGKSYVVDPNEEPTLKAEYYKVVEKIFGADMVKKLEEEDSGSDNKQKHTDKATDKSYGKKSQQGQQKQQPEKLPEVYEITNILVEGDGNKKRSKLELTRGNGRSTVFMNGADPQLKVGSRIKNIKGRTGENIYGKFSVLESYELAA